MEYNELSRQELIGYLMDFVEGLEQHTLDADEQGFVELHKKIIWELCHDRIYKVTFCRPDQEAASKLAEYDTQYFSSLKEAKRELHRRMKRLQKQSVLALPEEIRNHRLLTSIAPELDQSIISSRDLPLEGGERRFQFYELRIWQQGEIRPVLMLLSEVITEPSVLEETAPSRTAPKHGKVISFTDIQPRS